MADLVEDEREYKRRAWAWALYDVANSSFFLLIVTAVFPIFYQDVYAAAHPQAGPAVLTQGGAALAFTATIAMAVVAVLGPVLGAVADRCACKKKLLAGFAGVGILATAGMAFIGPTDWILASVLYAVGTVGVAGSMVFYDALLPAVAKPADLDRISTFGFAAGYLGSVLLFGFDILLLLKPGLFGLSSYWAPRVVFLTVAAWWAVFTLPVLKRVPEPACEGDGRFSLWGGFRQIASTFRKALGYRQLLLFLLAYWVYSDGIGTIIKLATPFGKALAIPDHYLLFAIILSNLIGVPCALGFGRLARRIGAKRAILFGVAVFAGICVFARFMSEPWHFFVLAAGVGLVQGGTQALSRSFFATLVPRGQTGEFFGFFSSMEKFAGIIGPLILGAFWSEGRDPRPGVSWLVLFFLVGGALLWLVDVRKGQEAAARA